MGQSFWESRAGKTVLASLLESQKWHQPAGSVAFCGEGSESRQWTLRALLSGRRLFSSSCLDDRQFRIFLYMPLVPFKLPPLCWRSEAVSLSKSVCGFFKRNCLGLQKFLPLSESSLVFAARCYGDLSSWHWSFGLRGLVWDWDFFLLRYPSQIFIHHMWIWDEPIPCL